MRCWSWMIWTFCAGIFHEYFLYHKWPLMVKIVDHRRSKVIFLKPIHVGCQIICLTGVWSRICGLNHRLVYSILDFDLRTPEVKIITTGSLKALHLKFLNPNIGVSNYMFKLSLKQNNGINFNCHTIQNPVLSPSKYYHLLAKRISVREL